MNSDGSIGGAAAPLLSVAGLQVTVPTPVGPRPALRGVGFDLAARETLCLVGESASGKSLTALSLLGLLGAGMAATGSITLRGQPILNRSDAQMSDIRGREIAMIFQEAIPAMNPVLRVGDQIAEALQRHTTCGRRSARRQAVSLLAAVGIARPPQIARAWPHELSGGMAQRVMIAMALATRPAIVIADEPTTALDVTIQAQILDLLDDLRVTHSMAMLLITHDMGVVAEMADRVAVMYAGRIVEMAPVTALFDHPRHPYSKALLDTRPSLETGQRTAPIGGEPPALERLPTGCAFAPRCPRADLRCTSQDPEMTMIGNRQVACHYPLVAV